MKRASFALLLAVLTFAAATFAQTSTNIERPSEPSSTPSQSGAAVAELATRPWEYGPFFQGGKGVGDRGSFRFFSAGVRLGKVMTPPLGPGFLRGQFEYAGELMPYWQALTPPPHEQTVTYHDPATGLNYSYNAFFGGGTFTGFSLTPIILRWDLQPHGRIAPWIQAAGGLIYTTHKFPPDVLVPHGTPGGTSVFNFSPQGGVGIQYFLSPTHSLMLSANGVHISSASLGDRNPGINASVQFQIGYTWWSRKPAQ